MSITKRTIPGAALAVLLCSAVAGARFAGIGDYKASFVAVGPGGLKINGTTNEVSVSERDGKISVKVALGNVATGISLRDKHLKQHLETNKYPDALLTVPRSRLHIPEDKQDASGTASGALTLHGVTKTVSFHYSAHRTGSDVHVDGSSSLNMKDFGVEPPCYLGVCVKPDVAVSAHFKVREQ